MAALFPANEDTAGHVDSTQCNSLPSVITQQGFSSFNATSFALQEHSKASDVDQGVWGEHLKRAIDYYLPSSSESDDDRNDTEAPGSRHPAQDLQSTDTQSESRQSLRKIAKQIDKKHEKKRKHRKREKERAVQQLPGFKQPEPKRSRTDVEKIEILEQRAAATGDLTRVSKPQQWKSLRGPQTAMAAGDASGISDHSHYVDTTGDRENAVYGSLYALDQASYARHDPLRFAAGAKARWGHSQGIHGETDGASQRGRSGRLRRFFLASVAKQESDGTMRRIRYKLTTQANVQGALRSSIPPPLVLPLRAEKANQVTPDRERQERRQRGTLSDQESEQDPEARDEGETEEQRLRERGRLLNASVREKPQDLQQWFDLAAFQDTLLASTGRGSSREEAAVADKKAAILERALEHHPSSDLLLLELLRLAAAVRDRSEATNEWRSVLRHHSGRPALWRAYLAFRRSEFSAFTTRRMRHLHDDALDALARERVALQAASAPAVQMEVLERCLVTFLIDASAADVASGHTELAVSRLQAALEYDCFAPAVFENDSEKSAAFRDFWSSGAPLVGEPDGRGWFHHRGSSTAASTVTEAPKNHRRDKSAVAAGDTGGGWSGWVSTSAQEPSADDDTASVGAVMKGDQGNEADPSAADGGSGGDSDAEDLEAAPPDASSDEETEDQLMARLGLQLEEQLADQGEGITPEIAAAWVATEDKRSALQWRPSRQSPDKSSDLETDDIRLVSFADLEDSLFTLVSGRVREELALAAVALLGAPVPQECCSSNHNGSGGSRAVRSAHCTAVAQLGISAEAVMRPWNPRSHDPLSWRSSGASELGPDLNWLVPRDSSRPWYLEAPSRRDFLAALLKRLLSDGAPLQGHPGACLALLVVEAAPPAMFAHQEASSQDGSQDGSDVVMQPPPPPGTTSAETAAVCSRPDWDRARNTAKELLSQRRGDAGMYSAYAQIEAHSGRPKASRRAFDAAAAAASSFVATSVTSGSEEDGSYEAALAVAADVAVAAVEAELTLGGRESLGRAAHMLIWIGRGPASYEPLQGGTSEGRDGQLILARRGLQNMISRCVAFAAAAADDAVAASAAASSGAPNDMPGGISDTTAAAAAAAVDNCRAVRSLPSLVAAAALLEEILPAVAPSLAQGGDAAGIRAASRIYRQVLEAAPAYSRAGSTIFEGIEVWHCRLLTSGCLTRLPAVTPRDARDAVLRALQLWPHNGELPAMLAAAGAAAGGGAMQRRRLVATAHASASPDAWLIALRSEALRMGGSLHLQALFEKLLSSEHGATCPLLWRCYIAFESGRSRPQAARRVYLRAIHACPGAASLWHDGFVMLQGVLPPAEAAELLQLSAEKGIASRTDIFEIKLAAATVAAGLQSP